MLRKKDTIQKTFRLNYKVNDDFETLCEILERTQNDLANVAIENLLEENKYWLAQNILVDYAIDFFGNCSDTEFEVEGIKVQIKYIDEENIEFTLTQKDEQGNVIQEVKEQYNETKDADYDKKIIEELRYFGQLIDFNSKVVQEYLKLNMNYK